MGNLTKSQTKKSEERMGFLNTKQTGDLSEEKFRNSTAEKVRDFTKEKNVDEERMKDLTDTHLGEFTDERIGYLTPIHEHLFVDCTKERMKGSTKEQMGKVIFFYIL